MPENQVQRWRKNRDLTVHEMADYCDVSPRLITKIEADPEGYILKSDTMAKISAGIGVPAFMLFFPEDIKFLNRMMGELLKRQARVFTGDSLVNMFQSRQIDADAFDPPRRVRA